MDRRAVKAGIIGCGMIARRGHIPAYRGLNVDIAAVADPRIERAESCARKFNIKKFFSDYHNLLAEDLDIVSVCTPNATHAAITIDAAKGGKNVLVEKPMATNLRDADKMIEACKVAGVKLCVMHNYRMIPCVQEARRRVAEGRVGDIVSIHVVGHDFIPMSWSSSKWFYHKWGLLEDLGVHLIDIVNYVCRSPLKTAKVLARDFTGLMGCLNHIQAILVLENNASVDIDLSWVTGSFERTLDIFGTAGTVSIDLRNDHLREIHGYSTPIEELLSYWEKARKIAKGVLNKTYFKAGMLYESLIIRQFVESIVNDTKPPVTGEEGRAAIAIMDAIKNSAGLGP